MEEALHDTTLSGTSGGAAADATVSGVLPSGVLAAAERALRQDGAGTTGSRAANGTLAAHRRLEERFAYLFGKRHGMLFTTGYQANVGMITGLCGPDDAIVLDTTGMSIEESIAFVLERYGCSAGRTQAE